MMANGPLEFLARKYDNVIRYDTDGNPSVFVKFAKMLSSDLDSSLPNHTHPAFIINGVEQDYILIGKYCGSCLDGSNDKTIYSLPNAIPAVSRTHSQFMQQCRAFGNGVAAMTMADYGLLMLLAQKNGWDPQGNSSNGSFYSYGQSWTTNITASENGLYTYRGYLWKCLSTHETSVNLAPVKAQQLWKRLRRIGGTEATKEINGTDITVTTLTGSGPYSWYLNGKPDGVADIVGNVMEHISGYRVNAGELQILENNNAASPEEDISDSGNWRAILPHANDDGHTLVPPGTAGTLHWTWANGKITLDTVAPVLDGSYRGTTFRTIDANQAHIPVVPAIVRELGIFPQIGCAIKGSVYYHFFNEVDIPLIGGNYASGSNIGLGYNYQRETDNFTHRGLGVRLRALQG